MKIGFLATRLVKYDAISNHTIAVLEKLSKEHDVDLYAFSIEIDLPDNVRQYNYTRKKEHSMSSFFLATVHIYSLAKILSKYDLLILYGPDIPIIFSAHISRHLNPNIIIVWDYQSTTPLQFLSLKNKTFKFIRQFAILESIKKSNYVLVRSEYVKKELKPYIPNEKIKITPIGISFKTFQNANGLEVREKYDAVDKFILFYVGRLVSHKQVDNLVKAMSKLDNDTILIIVGGGDQRNQLEDLAISIGVKDRIIFAGKVSDEDLPKYYAASDVFVTASMHEGFCVPILESFASGKPVIVPNRTAMPEVAQNNGLIYDGSMEDFLHKVEILRDKSMNIANKQINVSAEKYNITNVSDRYKEVIEKLCTKVE